MDWSADRIIRGILDVASDPGSIVTRGRGGRLVVTGTRDGIDFRVIVDANGDVITGYPVNLPRNP